MMVRNTLVKIRIGSGATDPSKSNLTLNSKFTPFWVFHAITHQQLTLEIQNLEHKCMLALLRSLSILGPIDLVLDFIFENWNIFLY